MPWKRPARVLMFGLWCVAPASAQPANDSGRSEALAAVCAKVLCRKPGHVFQLHMADGKIFETTTEGYPYLDDKGAVLIYPGETIAITLEMQGGGLRAQLTNVMGLDGPLDLPAGSASLSTLSFTLKQDPKIGMMLTATNAINLAIKYDAQMFVPTPAGVKLVHTSICPLLPPQGDAKTFSGLENWPYPIVMMVLSNIRVQPDGASRTCE
jgi:hypothetical protein